MSAWGGCPREIIQILWLVVTNPLLTYQLLFGAYGIILVLALKCNGPNPLLITGTVFDLLKPLCVIIRRPQGGAVRPQCPVLPAVPLLEEFCQQAVVVQHRAYCKYVSLRTRQVQDGAVEPRFELLPLLDVLNPLVVLKVVADYLIRPGLKAP